MASAELTLCLYDSSGMLTVWVHDARPDFVLIRTNRGATIELDRAAVDALRDFLLSNQPRKPEGG